MKSSLLERWTLTGPEINRVFGAFGDEDEDNEELPHHEEDIHLSTDFSAMAET